MKISDLPSDALLKIFSFLCGRDIIACSKVCKLWNRLTDQHSLWRIVYHTEIDKLSCINRRVAELVERSCVRQYASGKHSGGAIYPSGSLFESKYLKALYEYIDNFKTERSNKDSTKNDCTLLRRCIFLGPGLDELKLYDQLYEALLNLESEPSNPVKICNVFSHRRYIKFPTRNELIVTFVCARNIEDRIGTYKGGSRISGSHLFNSRIDEFGVKHVSLAPSLKQMVQIIDVVVYGINVQVEEKSQEDDEFWSEMRDELEQITNHMLRAQVLLILGIVASDDEENYLSTFDLLHRLGGSEREESCMFIQPLAKPGLNWRICSLAGCKLNVSSMKTVFRWICD